MLLTGECFLKLFAASNSLPVKACHFDSNLMQLLNMVELEMYHTCMTNKDNTFWIMRQVPISNAFEGFVMVAFLIKLYFV